MCETPPCLCAGSGGEGNLEKLGLCLKTSDPPPRLKLDNSEDGFLKGYA